MRRLGRRTPTSYFWHLLGSPYFRYLNARYLHAIRVGVAVAASIGLTAGLGIPHGFWASVTLLVVIGGLQHHGNIRRKAFERGVATGIGAVLGLALIGQHALLGSNLLTYALASIMAGVCAYHAIGRAGYIALLTAITLVIVAGNGSNPIDVGLWRAANVAIGTVLALLFSFALPLYATYDWRFRLADNLRECARLYPRVMIGTALSASEQVTAFARLSQRLVVMRSLIYPVSRELGVDAARLEEIQRLHRSILCGLEILAAANDGRDDAPHWGDTHELLGIRRSVLRRLLLAMSRALRSGDTRRLGLLVARHRPDAPGPAPDRALAYHMQGSYWLAQRLAEQVHALADEIARLQLR
ncbi:FUSC family protein [Salinisphaera sp. Q1T1-3]|uniref:FUSC family protein n=1 Tax=Salinisphaera sp. Q1T1-3 TaxID=2321229 RepID=UPI000E75256C|nr:FUSC family protein [Salinisphaera sp. Q1T1-3]RJS95236.1 FUSC family protein [Salinisphaera sp. Q1T1-3]